MAAYSSSRGAPSHPAGTFLPGTKVQVGSHRVVIEKYLSEGGFAHVYVVRLPHPDRDPDKHELAVLKRVAVPDREHLASMRTEVETMKKLKGHRKVVTYMDSHASQLKGGGYEVFLLMEYCAGGGLIDFMNTRLQHRLTEAEILKIFGDVAEGVACMHYLKPPLLHRDLKVENVLISKGESASSRTPTYKLCDFGSAAPPRPAAKTAEEGRLIEEDVQKHTTMQYRSPEMIDVWRKQAIDEKADIWALAVLLYKLCYYITPFEDVGRMAILNASFKYPPYPAYSDRLKKLIGWCLKEDPKQRPNIYQVVSEVCKMRGVECPVKDIYTNRMQPEARRNQELPSPHSPSTSPPVGLQKAGPTVQVQALPDITPMRRGRPTVPAQNAPVAVAKASPSPAKGDPFAALDSKSYDVRAGAVDELSKRFPSLDEFSIAHEKSGSLSFHASGPKAAAGGDGLNERVTKALADEAFAIKPQAAAPTRARVVTDVPKSQSASDLSQQQSRPKTSPEKPRVAAKVHEFSQQSPLMHQPIPIRPGSTGYKSTGVGSSPPPPKSPRPTELKHQPAEPGQRPIWRVPTDDHRSASQPRASDQAQREANRLQPSLPPAQRPALLDLHRSKSQTVTVQAAQYTVKSPTSSRPSLESRRSSHLELHNASGVHRAKSEQNRQRPSSVYVSNNLEFFRDHESGRKRRSLELSRRHSRQPSAGASAQQSEAEEESNRKGGIFGHRKGEAEDESNRKGLFGHRKLLNEDTADEQPIEDDMDFLKNEEESQGIFRKHGWKSSSGPHKKRGSLPKIFGGRLGDAFKKFEHSSGDDRSREEAGPRTPEARGQDDGPKLQNLSPIPGSEATQTPSKLSTATADEAESAIGEEEDLPPDVRRELERRRLSQEEKRVADAAAEYKARMAAQASHGTGSGQPVTRASTIQKRVQNMLDESGRQSPIARTAMGYGSYTDAQASDADSRPPALERSDKPLAKATPAILARKPMPANTFASNNPYPKTRQQQTAEPSPASVPPASQPAPLTGPTQLSQAPLQRIVSRPSVPPKSQALRTGGSGKWPPQPEASIDKLLPPKSSGGLAALLAKDLEGVPEYPPRGSSAATIANNVPEYPPRGSSRGGGAEANGQFGGGAEDVEAGFSKRYPSLAGIEMVETEIGGSQPSSNSRQPMRVREV